MRYMLEDKIKYFAYGSNLNKTQMKKRGVEIYDSELVKLPGWRLAFTYNSPNWGGGVLDIVPCGDGGLVEGVVYTIDEQGLKALDFYEGRETRNDIEVGVYRRQFKPVDRKQKWESVLTYVVNRTYEYRLNNHFPPSKKYMDTVIEGAKEHGLNDEYLRKLEKIETI